MSENVLITGAVGFVGMQLARSLMADAGPIHAPDYQVVSMIRDRTKGPPGHNVVHGDVRDADFCRRVIADYEIGTIYHLAAQSIVSVCAEDPVTALDIAVMGTARLLQAVRDIGRPCRVVVMTSDKVYGHAPPPYTESTPLDARHAYEVSKACQDLVARMFFSNYGLDVRVVRAVNIYGPADPNDSRIIPKTIQRCLRGDPPLLHAGAGNMQRQYIYIDDMVAALRFVAGLPMPMIGTSLNWPAPAVCVGSLEAPLSVTGVMETICHACDVTFKAPDVQARDERFQEIAAQAIDDSFLRSLGWAPTVSFREGIARSVAWYRDRPAR